MRIMIVDDNSGIRRLVRSILEKQLSTISEIIFCENGSIALEHYLYKGADLVIMDIQMPVMNGLVAAEKILHHDKEARIILMSQYDEPEYREKAEKIGVSLFVQKEYLVEIPGLINYMNTTPLK